MVLRVCLCARSSRLHSALGGYTGEEARRKERANGKFSGRRNHGTASTATWHPRTWQRTPRTGGRPHVCCRAVLEANLTLPAAHRCPPLAASTDPSLSRRVATPTFRLTPRAPEQTLIDRHRAGVDQISHETSAPLSPACCAGAAAQSAVSAGEFLDLAATLFGGALLPARGSASTGCSSKNASDPARPRARHRRA